MEGKNFKNIQDYCSNMSFERNDMLDMINAAAFCLCSIRVHFCGEELAEEMEQIFIALSHFKDLLLNVE